MSALTAFPVTSFSVRTSFALEPVTPQVAVDKLGLRKFYALHFTEGALLELFCLRHQFYQVSPALLAGLLRDCCLSVGEVRHRLTARAHYLGVAGREMVQVQFVLQILSVIIDVAVKFRLLAFLASVQFLGLFFLIIYGNVDAVDGDADVVGAVLRFLRFLLSLLELRIYNPLIVTTASALRTLPHVVARKRILAVGNQTLRAYQILSVLHRCVLKV